MNHYSDFQESDHPTTADGRLLFLEIKKLDVANRVLMVGDMKRAFKMSRFFDNPCATIVIEATRGFRIYTGKFGGKPITVIGTGMGTPLTDITIRELRRAIDGPIAMARFGTTGIIGSRAKLGDVIVQSEGNVYCQTDFQSLIFGGDTKKVPYHLSKPTLPDKGLTDSVLYHMRSILGDEHVTEGMGCTTDSFYGSQGRHDKNFKDQNDGLKAYINETLPNVENFEMESHCVMVLGNMTLKDPIHCTTAAIGLINRQGNEILSAARYRELEDLGGFAMLKGLTQFSFPDGESVYAHDLLDRLN